MSPRSRFAQEALTQCPGQLLVRVGYPTNVGFCPAEFDGSSRRLCRCEAEIFDHDLQFARMPFTV